MTPAKEEKESAGIFGGSKKIVMDRCRNCPLRETNTDSHLTPMYYCTHPNTEGWELEYLDIIPLWCNLEDN